jgi:hypothetical protein
MIFDFEKIKDAWCLHRIGARRRKIGFLLSFDEWLSIWIKSGKLPFRGSRRGQYVMARLGDKGPYAVGNVKIITTEENVREWGLGRKHTEETKAKIGNKSRARKQTKESRRKNREAHLGKKRSEETTAKIMKTRAVLGVKMSFAGRHHSDEAKQKISKTHKGKPKSELTKKLLSESQRRYQATAPKRVLSEEERKRRSEGALLFWARKKSLSEKSP